MVAGFIACVQCKMIMQPCDKLVTTIQGFNKHATTMLQTRKFCMGTSFTYIHMYKCMHTHVFYIFAGGLNDNSDLGAIIGGVIGGVVVLVIAVGFIAVICFCIKKQPCNRNPVQGRDY